jgi:hypothetical protein
MQNRGARPLSGAIPEKKTTATAWDAWDTMETYEVTKTLIVD